MRDFRWRLSTGPRRLSLHRRIGDRLAPPLQPLWLIRNNLPATLLWLVYHRAV